MDVLFAPAKLNLFLEVLSKRSDGYHDLDSVFARISLYDLIRIDAFPSQELKIEVEFLYQDVDPIKNTVYRAVELFCRHTGKKLKVRVLVSKYIPQGAGLGGGSSDGAAVLKWLNDRFGGLDKKGLFELAMKLGSDVGFFVADCQYAKVEGRGERVFPLGDLPKRRFVVFYPGIFISTKDVYGALKLTYTPLSANISNSEGDFSALWFNRLQGVVEELLPNYKSMLDEFSQVLSRKVIMTGSGSAFFTLWDPDIDWERLCSLARKHNCCVWCVETV